MRPSKSSLSEAIAISPAHRPSGHCDGERFFNPWDGTAGQPFSRVPKMMLERRTPWPRQVAVVPQRPLPRGDAAAAITFIGHATFLIQTADANLLTDPVYSRHAGPFGRLGPRRVRQPAVRVDDLPHIDAILLSHCHYDHCDLPTLRRLRRRFDPLVITPLGNSDLLRAAGIRRHVELDWWDATGDPLPVTLTPARHFSARTPWDKNRRLWGGFVLTTGGRRIYFAGDTAYAPFFADIRGRLGPIDLALLPIGAYEPRWFMHVVHVNPEEAVRAHQELQAARSVAMHFGTFQLTLEGIDGPARALAAARRAHGVADSEFQVPGFGETMLLR